MQERVRQLGGRLEIQSSKGGTTVIAILPTESRSGDDLTRAAEVAS
jgi:signal transduction histidine kinase